MLCISPDSHRLALESTNSDFRQISFDELVKQVCREKSLQEIYEEKLLAFDKDMLAALELEKKYNLTGSIEEQKFRRMKELWQNMRPGDDPDKHLPRIEALPDTDDEEKIRKWVDAVKVGQQVIEQQNPPPRLSDLFDLSDIPKGMVEKLKKKERKVFGVYENGNNDDIDRSIVKEKVHTYDNLSPEKFLRSLLNTPPPSVSNEDDGPTSIDTSEEDLRDPEQPRKKARRGIEYLRKYFHEEIQGKDQLQMLNLEEVFGTLESNISTHLKEEPYGWLSTFAGDISTKEGTSFNDNKDTDDMGTLSQFHRPYSVVYHPDRFYLVSDMEQQVIRKIDMRGEVSIIAGVANEKGTIDGSAENSRFYRPASMAIHPSGDVLISDMGACVIRRISRDLSTVSTFSGYPPNINQKLFELGGHREATEEEIAKHFNFSENEDILGLPNEEFIRQLDIWEYFFGVKPSNMLSEPDGIVVSETGHVYVCDTSHHRIVRFTPEGGFNFTVVSGEAHHPGYSDGNAKTARFNAPHGLSISQNPPPEGGESLYVADTLNDCIRRLNLKTDQVTTISQREMVLAGTLTRKNEFTEFPPSVDTSNVTMIYGIKACDFGRKVFYSRSAWHRIDMIRNFSSHQIIVGNKNIMKNIDGSTDIARLKTPGGITISPEGDIIFCDIISRQVKRVKQIMFKNESMNTDIKNGIYLKGNNEEDDMAMLVTKVREAMAQKSNISLFLFDLLKSGMEKNVTGLNRAQVYLKHHLFSQKLELPS